MWVVLLTVYTVYLVHTLYTGHLVIFHLLSGGKQYNLRKEHVFIGNERLEGKKDLISVRHLCSAV